MDTELPAAFACPFCGECFTEEWIGAHIAEHTDPDARNAEPA